MTKDDIIAMAREAGIKGAAVGWNAWTVDLERFAALIASRVAAASASVEREACAKVCADLHIEGEDDTGLAADLIRARSGT